MEFKWGPQQESAFCQLKHRLMNPPVLTNPDFSKTNLMVPSVFLLMEVVHSTATKEIIVPPVLNACSG